MSEMNNMNLDDLAMDTTADADLDLDALSATEPTDDAEATEQVVEEKYEKNSKYNNSDDYLRKFAESFSSDFVLSLSLLSQELTNDKALKALKEDQSFKKAKAAEATKSILADVKKQMNNN